MWTPDEAVQGEFLARGIYGQYIYVNRAAGLVIALNFADRGFPEPKAYASNIAKFRKIASL